MTKKMFKNLYRLLDSKYKSKVTILVGLMLFGMFIETLSIATLIPTMGIMSGTEFTNKYPIIKEMFGDISKVSSKTLILISMSSLVGVYLIKFVFLSILAWVQAKVLFGIQSNISLRLLRKYMFQTYSFHLENNSSKLLRNVVIETNILTSALTSIFNLITDLFVMVGISCLLFFYEPEITSLIFVTLFLTTFSFHKLTNKYIVRWGKMRQFYEGLRMQHAQQGLNGIKEFKILGREHNLLLNYNVYNLNNSKVNQFQNFLQQVPRLVLELVAIFTTSIIAIFIVFQGKSIDVMLPTLGLFLASAFRLLPSINRIVNGIQNTKFVKPVIDLLYNELVVSDNLIVDTSVKSKFDFKKTILISNLTFKYNLAKRNVLTNVNIVINIGESIGFIGSSGAGKSTLICLLTGLLKPDTGKIFVDEKDININIRGWQNNIGYVPQSVFLTDDTLRRNIAFGLPDEEINEQSINDAVKSAQLEDFILNLPDGLETLVGERGVRLSGGQIQRIGIARALYNDPQVLILDEATSSLDIYTENEVMESIKGLKGKKTIIIVAHRYSTIQHCDEIFKFENGVIVEKGTPEFILGK